MNGTRFRFWAYLAATYTALMLPVVLSFAWLAKRNRPDATLLDYATGLVWVWAWPLSLVLGIMASWYLGAVLAFLFWKLAELLQFVTGLPFGTRIGRAIARDHFFVHASPTSPYAWVHRKAIAVYPPVMDANAND
jgi:hypothetical protein